MKDLVIERAEQRLTTTRQLLAYLNERIQDAGEEESFWLLCLTADHRPICCQRLKRGTLVAARLDVAEIFREAAARQAQAIVCLRTQPGGPVEPGLADGRLLWNIREMANRTSIGFVDYLIARPDRNTCYSWRENYPQAA